MSDKTYTKTLVQFTRVGRGKKTWQAEVEWTEGSLCDAVHESGALMSTFSVSCEIDSQFGGTVYAGMRPVGTFERLK